LAYISGEESVPLSGNERVRLLPGIVCGRIAAGRVTMTRQPEFIESTAGEVATELARRGVAPGQRVTITIEPDEPDDWITKARKFARPKIIAEGWTDADIDRVIKEERKAVQPRLA
jgi:hypothetical protein